MWDLQVNLLLGPQSAIPRAKLTLENLEKSTFGESNDNEIQDVSEHEIDRPFGTDANKKRLEWIGKWTDR